MNIVKESGKLRQFKKSRNWTMRRQYQIKDECTFLINSEDFLKSFFFLLFLSRLGFIGTRDDFNLFKCEILFYIEVLWCLLMTSLDKIWKTINRNVKITKDFNCSSHWNMNFDPCSLYNLERKIINFSISSFKRMTLH